MHAVEQLGFGCVRLTAMPTAGAAQKLLEGVFDLGIRHFDTAPVYGRGYSERLLGAFAKRRRGQVTIATKFGLGANSAGAPAFAVLPLHALRRRLRPAAPQAPSEADRPFAPYVRTITRAQVEAELAASLSALQTDYIDLYLLHEGVPAYLEPAAQDFLRNLKAIGRVRRLGLAANGQNYLSLSAADLCDWDVLQYESGPAWPRQAPLRGMFPDKIHNLHSCLKGVRPDDAGAAIAAEVAGNTNGKVLFSSSKLGHVRANIQALTV